MFEFNATTDVYFLQQQKRYPTSQAHQTFQSLVRILTAGLLSVRTREINDGTYYSLCKGVDREEMLRNLFKALDERVKDVCFLWKKGNDIVVLDREDEDDKKLICDCMWNRMVAYCVTWVKNQEALKRQNMMLKIKLQSEHNQSLSSSNENSSVSNSRQRVANNIESHVLVPPKPRRGRPRKNDISVGLKHKRSRPRKYGLRSSTGSNLSSSNQRCIHKTICSSSLPSVATKKKKKQKPCSRVLSSSRKKLQQDASDVDSDDSSCSESFRFEKSFINASKFDVELSSSSDKDDNSSFSSGCLSDTEDKCISKPSKTVVKRARRYSRKQSKGLK